MPTWSDVQSHVRSRYRLQTDAGQHFILAWQIEDAKRGLEEALVQGVHCQPLTSGEQTFLILRAEVCSERTLNPLAALHHSARLILGALVLSGNHYVLRYTMPLRSLDFADLDYALEYLAREAAGTRQRLAQQGAHPVRSSD